MAQGVGPDFAAYLVQQACLDAGGAPQPGLLPFEPGCTARRPLGTDDPLPYRKHDWPGRADAAAAPQGYQASDSLLGRLRGAPAIVQSFDFGHAPRAFGRHDAGLGDGGQVALLAGDGAALVLTEDGAGGLQWFLDAACAPGWLIAAAPLREEWESRVARLRIAPAPDACPQALDASLTRWRRAEIALPWREAAGGATATTPAEVLVSEHFGGAAIAGADHLERFWYARGLGLVRWERWEHRRRSRRPEQATMARQIAGSGRCPPIAFSVSPGPGWAMLDCRTWTNFVRARPGALLAAPGWPDAALR